MKAAATFDLNHIFVDWVITFPHTTVDSKDFSKCSSPTLASSSKYDLRSTSIDLSFLTNAAVVRLVQSRFVKDSIMVKVENSLNFDAHQRI